MSLHIPPKLRNADRVWLSTLMPGQTAHDPQGGRRCVEVAAAVVTNSPGYCTTAVSAFVHLSPVVWCRRCFPPPKPDPVPRRVRVPESDLHDDEEVPS